MSTTSVRCTGGAPHSAAAQDRQKQPIFWIMNSLFGLKNPFFGSWIRSSEPTTHFLDHEFVLRAQKLIFWIMNSFFGPKNWFFGPWIRSSGSKTHFLDHEFVLRTQKPIFGILNSFFGANIHQPAFIKHRKMPKIMKSGMNQVQVPPFDPKLRQDKATASRTPPECPPPPSNKKKRKSKKMPKMRCGGA